MEVISDCLRGFIVPKSGHDFIGCDFSAIEARVTAWLARETRVLEAFEQGVDVYVEEAKGIYNCTTQEVDSDRRLVGKVAVLALGFGGGVGAFQQMAKAYGVKVTDEEADAIKARWRDRNYCVVQMWYGLERAALQALKTTGWVKTNYRGIAYKKSGSFLLCRLPNGRQICYPYPRIEIKQTPWFEKRPGLTAKWVNGTTKKWERRDVWYGILTENVVQAVARDLLVEAIFRLEDVSFYETVMHVHDEVLLEVPKGYGDVQHVEEIMSIVPDWAKGLPVAAEGWRGNRYRK